jgi:hypothetical protein
LIYVQAVSDPPPTDAVVASHVSESVDVSDAEEFVSNLIVSPNSVLDVNHEVGLSIFWV